MKHKSTEESLTLGCVFLFPTAALPASGSEGLISARVLRHPYWL